MSNLQFSCALLQAIHNLVYTNHKSVANDKVSCVLSLHMHLNAFLQLLDNYCSSSKNLNTYPCYLKSKSLKNVGDICINTDEPCSNSPRLFSAWGEYGW